VEGGLFQFSLYFLDSLSENEISWEPQVQITKHFHFWDPRIEIFKIISHVDRFWDTFFLYFIYYYSCTHGVYLIILMLELISTFVFSVFGVIFFLLLDNCTCPCARLYMYLLVCATVLLYMYLVVWTTVPVLPRVCGCIRTLYVTVLVWCT
jgi:hypothetical protein